MNCFKKCINWKVLMMEKEKKNISQLSFYWTFLLICVVHMLPPYPFAFFTFFFHLLLFSSHWSSVSWLWSNATQSPMTPKWIYFAFADPASAQLERTTWFFNFSFHRKCKLFKYLAVVKWLHSCRPENKLFYLKKVNTISFWPMSLETVWR